MQPSVFVLGSAACAMKILCFASSLPWGVSSAFVSDQTSQYSVSPCSQLNRCGGLAFHGFAPAAAAAAAAGRAGAAAAAGRAAAAVIVVGGGGSVGEVGEGRGFSGRIEAGFPPPICKAPGNKGAGVLLQDGPPACPPPPCRPGPRRRRSHLLHYRVVLNWTAPCAARSARARARRAARQSPSSPRGQRG